MTIPARRLISSLAAGFLVIVSCGCAASALTQARIADSLHDDDVAVAQWARILRTHPESKEAQIGLNRARQRGSEAHLLRGRRFASAARYEDAQIELQLAAELNPLNTDAEKELHAVRVALRAKLSAPDQGPTALQSLIDRTRDLTAAGPELPDVVLPTSIVTGNQTTIRDLYMLLAVQGNLSVTFDNAFADGPAQVTLLRNMTLKQALDAVGTSTNTFYRIASAQTIHVVNDTQEKRREYSEDVQRQFVLQNTDVKETIEMLRVVADVRYVAPIGANTIVVRDTPERVQSIGLLLNAIDKARPEVVVDVEILEVDRSKLQEYGVQIATPGSPGIDGSLDANRSGLTLHDVLNLGTSDVLVTIPALYYRLIRTDASTRILANPHIRIIDGVTAAANFGEEVPVVTTQILPITAGGLNLQPQSQIEYRKVGVNIGITPRAHPNEEVTLNLNVELSSLSGLFQGNPTFASRHVTTGIRLRDGETSVLAGLIRDDERTERQSLPGFGSIPMLGQLLAKNHTDRLQTDVVIMLTPHIIRVLAISEDDLRPLRLPKAGSAGGGPGGGPGGGR